MLAEETTFYLEMLAPSELRPALPPGSFFQPDAPRSVEIRRVEVPSPELNRFFYTAVGGDWYWIDRLPWTIDQWRQSMARPGHETWMLLVAGSPAGYFELDLVAYEVEIAYFGLLPAFVGQGLGGYLLTAATERAWSLGAARVWVHTSSFDHPQALANYLARGFRLYHEEQSVKELPAAPPGPWPGANSKQ